MKSAVTMRFPFLLVVGSLVIIGTNAQYGAMEAPNGLSPRYYLGAVPQLARRQSGDCGSGNHSCLDVGAPEACCANTDYCIIGDDFSALCCTIGSLCGNLCDAEHYECPVNTTISGTATISTGCCSRGCPSTSAYKCASAYGGGCCSYDSSCAVSGLCVATVQPDTSSTAVATAVAGCTTSQISCASSLGGGCCNNGASCTVLSNSYYCASNTALATRTGADGTVATAEADNGSSSSGMSTGAKAGIGAGVAVLTIAVVGGLLWFCMAKRRNAAKSHRDGSSAPDMSHTSASGLRKGQNDYFGPAAAIGPYTEDHTVPTSPHSPGMNRGVPAKPHSPGDIAVPVEIDSQTTSNVPSPGDFGYQPQSPIELP